jgi:hypothetical protein
MYCRNSRRWSQGFKGVVTLFASGTPDSSPTTNGLCLTGCVGHIMAPLLVGPSALCCSLACILASPVQYQRAVRGPLGKGDCQRARETHRSSTMARSTKSAAGHSLASAKSARFRHELQRSASHWPGRLVDLQFAVPDFAPGCAQS